jgi:hypothetical protein
MPIEMPTDKDLWAFERELRSMEESDIANERYTGVWGPYNPIDPTKSGWKVRMANRYLTARKEARDRRLQVAAIVAAFITAIIAIFVSTLAIPLDGNSVYCRLDPFNACKHASGP